MPSKEGKARRRGKRSTGGANGLEGQPLSSRGRRPKVGALSAQAAAENKARAKALKAEAQKVKAAAKDMARAKKLSARLDKEFTRCIKAHNKADDRLHNSMQQSQAANAKVCDYTDFDDSCEGRKVVIMPGHDRLSNLGLAFYFF